MSLGLASALVFGLSGAAISATADDGPTPEQQKRAQQPRVDEPFPGGYSSSVEEEDSLRAQALPDDVSPGAYRDGDRLVPRVYADKEHPKLDNGEARKSRFTAARLQQVKQKVTSLAGAKGVAFGVYYDATSDSVRVVGNLSRERLPAEQLRSGELSYEFAEDSGLEPPRTPR